MSRVVIDVSAVFSCAVTMIHDGPGILLGLEAIQTLPAELLNDGAKVFETLGTSCHVLAHFVHDEREGLSRTPEFAKIEGPFNDVLDC